jgi:hypothetical protein
MYCSVSLISSASSRADCAHFSLFVNSHCTSPRRFASSIDTAYGHGIRVGAEFESIRVEESAWALEAEVEDDEVVIGEEDGVGAERGDVFGSPCWCCNIAIV